MKTSLSSTILNLIKSSDRYVAIKINVYEKQDFLPTGNVVISLTQDVIKSFKLSRTITSTEKLCFQNIASASATLEVSLTDDTKDVLFKDKFMEIFFGISADKGVTYSYFRLCDMFVKDAVKNAKEQKFSIELVDIFGMMDKMISEITITYPATIQSIISAILDAFGYTLDTAELSAYNTSLLATIITECPFEGDMLARNYLAYLCEVALVFLTSESLTTAHVLCRGIKSYLTTEVDEDDYFNVDIAEFEIPQITMVSSKVNKDDIGVSSGILNEVFKRFDEYIAFDNPFLVGNESLQDILDLMLEAFSVLPTYFPTTISLIGRPDICCGDIIKVIRKEVEYGLPIFQSTLEFNGGWRSSFVSTGVACSDVMQVSGPVSNAIVFLNKKSNVLERDLDVTRSTITSIQGSLNQAVSQIEQTALGLEIAVTQTIPGIQENLQQNYIPAANMAEQLLQLVEDVDQKIADNVPANVKNTIVEINAQGLTIGSQGSDFTALHDNTGMYLQSRGTTIAQYTNAGAALKNLIVRDEAIIGNLMFRGVTIDGEKRSFIHFVGGV
jgi:hypothetical protein